MKHIVLLVAIATTILASACSQEKTAYKAERAARLSNEGRVEFEVTAKVTPLNFCSVEYPWL